MASRTFHQLYTQGNMHVDLGVTVLPNGTGVPTLGAGDPHGAYVSVVRTGVGAFTLTTLDPYLAVVSAHGDVSAATQAAWSVSFGGPTQNANNTWAIPFTIYDAGTATDLAANAANRVFLMLRMRNSQAVP